MTKMRVYELAKELGKTSKEIMQILIDHKFDVKNHMSTLGADMVKLVTESLKGEQTWQSKGELTHSSKSKNTKQQEPAKNTNKVGKADDKQYHTSESVNEVKRKQTQPEKGGRVSKPTQSAETSTQQMRRGKQNQRENNKFSFDEKEKRTNGPGTEIGGLGRGDQQYINTKHENKHKHQPSSQKRHPQPKQAQRGKPEHHTKQSTHHQQPHTPKSAFEKTPKKIKLNESLTVKELAEKLGKEVKEVILKLMSLGVMATINQEVDLDTAMIVASEFGFEVEEEKVVEAQDPLEIKEEEDDPTLLVPRPPVVTVMGHVDHGKTSLLDAIRLTNVTAQEAGGITQHIGAYQVEVNGKKITFLDTPGHEAFTAMRARGAQVTDIAVLVVAADDGVMPQTVEAINHAKAAQVPIIVAINKIDKPDANPDRVKQQLTEYNLIPEDWGGDTICVPISARQKKGINDLLEMILLVAEMAELKANPRRPAKGVVIEAELDKGRGTVATILIQNGTLYVGDAIVAGTAAGKVRAMTNDKGEKINEAGPSMPIEVLGLSDVPQAGDIMQVVADEKIARAITLRRLEKKRAEEMQKSHRVTLDELFKQIQEGEVKDLNIVIKADVQGSVEALRQSLERLTNKNVRVNIIHGGVGAISETDIMLAAASNAIIIGFNVRPDANARKAAENEKVDLRTYRVIYEAIEDVQKAMEGLLEPEYEEVVLGHAVVRALFKVPKVGVVAGCFVTDGKITRNASVRVLRNGVIVYEGKVDSLKRFKDDVREVAAGFECGIGLENFNDLKEEDVLESFTMEEVKRA